MLPWRSTSTFTCLTRSLSVMILWGLVFHYCLVFHIVYIPFSPSFSLPLLFSSFRSFFLSFFLYFFLSFHPLPFFFSFSIDLSIYLSIYLSIDRSMSGCLPLALHPPPFSFLPSLLLLLFHSPCTTELQNRNLHGLPQRTSLFSYVQRHLLCPYCAFPMRTWNFFSGQMLRFEVPCQEDQPLKKCSCGTHQGESRKTAYQHATELGPFMRFWRVFSGFLG